MRKLNNRFHKWLDKITEEDNYGENWARRLLFTVIMVLPVVAAAIWTPYIALLTIAFVISRMTRDIEL